MGKLTMVRVGMIALAIQFVVLAFVFASGLTFGQRCATHYPQGTAAWERCVYNLSTGGLLNQEKEGQ